MDIGLRAFGRCRQGNPKPLGLLIAGEGPERQNLEALANSLELGNSVSFLGWQEPQGMEAVYLASDIVLHPARSDPFPGVILEAMNWSRVVVGSDVCGNVEDRIISGVNGFSFPSENVDELARIMLDLVHHPSRLPEIGARARKTAETWPVERGVAIVLEQAAKILTARRKKMRILMVSPHYVPAYHYGGALHVAHSLGKSLVSQGHEVRVCTTNLRNPTEDLAVPVDAPVMVDGVQVCYEPTVLSRYWGFSPRLARRLWL